MTSLNGEGDRNDGVEGLYGEDELFNLQDYLL